MNNFHDLASIACDDEGVLVNDNFSEELYEFLINEQDEINLKDRLEEEGWLNIIRFAICLDDDVLVPYLRRLYFQDFLIIASK